MQFGTILLASRRHLGDALEKGTSSTKGREIDIEIEKERERGRVRNALMKEIMDSNVDEA